MTTPKIPKMPKVPKVPAEVTRFVTTHHNRPEGI